MKRVIVFICLIVFLIPLTTIKKKDFLNIDYKKITFISSNPRLIFDGEVVKNGNDFYYIIDKKDEINRIKNINLDDIKGVVLYISKTYDLNYFNNIFNYNLIQTRDVEGKKIYMGYYKGYNDFRLINGKKINFQLVENDDFWVLGFPLIMTGF